MDKRLVNLVFKLAFCVVGLVFVNNPASPFSIPIFWNDHFYWAPIFRADYVVFYQILFSIFILAKLLISVFEYVFYSTRPFCQLVEEIVELGQLMVIRDIPKAAVNLSASTLDQIFPVAFWVINIIMVLTIIGILARVIRLINKPQHHSKDK